MQGSVGSTSAGNRRDQPKDHNLRVAGLALKMWVALCLSLSSAQCAAHYMHDVQINVLPGCNEKSYLALTERVSASAQFVAGVMGGGAKQHNNYVFAARATD